MFKQIPKLDILSQIPTVLAQIFCFIFLAITYYKLVSTRNLPSYRQYLIAFCAIANPFVLHYVYNQPQVAILMLILMLLHFQFPYRAIITTILVVLAPQFTILIAGFEAKQIRNIFLLQILLLTICYLIFPQVTVTFFTQKSYPSAPLTHEPSLNFIWLIQSHMFPEYQNLYFVFFRIAALFLIYPLYQLRLPTSMYNLTATLIGIFLIEYCPIGWHFVLAYSYWVNYWLHRQRFIDEDEMLTQKIQNLIQKAQLHNQSAQFLTPFKFKLWLLIGITVLLAHTSFSSIVWLIIEKWGRSYQLNTGFVLLFMVIFWIFHVAAIVQLILISTPKTEYEWNQYVLTLKVDRQSQVSKVKKYLLAKWKIM